MRTSRTAAPAPPETLRGEVERFLASCRCPAILEPGLPPFPLAPDTYALSVRGSQLLLEAWDSERTFARRITALRSHSPGRLTLTVQRFGQPPGALTLADLDDSRATPALRRNLQDALAARFRLMLSRHYPTWSLDLLTTGADLQHTLSPAYPRALLRYREQRLAALCAPPGGAGHALTFALIWLDYLRRRHAPRPIAGLALFLPRGEESPTALRLRHLDPEQFQPALYSYDDSGDHPFPLDDIGNLFARLDPFHSDPALSPEPQGWARALSLEPGVETIPLGAGLLSFRIAGLEFARAAGPRLWSGIDRKRRARSLDELLRLARELAAIRLHPELHPHHEWARRAPEARLESLLRAQPQLLDPTLLPSPLYGQVCAISGRDRGLADLVALNHSGRLVLIEVKASEDPHLPLQALDYWIRLRHHAAAGDLTPAGYFPGRAILPLPPRLLLAAPALSFHPTTETLLGFFPSHLPVERIGLGVEWQRSLRVVLRVAGAARPEWHPAPPRRA